MFLGRFAVPALLRASLDRLRQVATEGGVSAVPGYLVRRLLRPLVSWETLLFFARDLSTLQVRTVAARIPLEIRETTKEELRGFQGLLLRAGKKQEDIEARFDRGDRCFLGLSNGEVVHFTWLAASEAWIPALRVSLRVAPGEAYLYDSFTDEAARGNGIQPAVASFIMRYEQAQGYARHLLYIRRGNFPALQVLGKATDTLPTLTRTVRRFSFAWPKGSLLTGLEGTLSPSFEFPESERVRRLGPLGYWMADGH